MATQYPERESKGLEFKSTVTKFDHIIKTSVAFANGVGGKIIVGIEDKTRNLIGIDNGLPKGVYIRIGSCTRRAKDEYIEELMRENRRLSYDEQAIQTDLESLSNELLGEHYKKISTAALLEDKIIARSVTNHDIFYPTVAGLMLFAPSPNHFIPEAHILCTRFAGTEGRDIIQTEEIQGPISKQIEVSFNLLASWLKRDYRLEGALMKAKSLVPKNALREAIINAVIHRKYTIPGATKIALYDNRLEIFSPGNFPGHININNLGEGITHFRNPIIGRMTHKMGIIEKLGSGIKLIFDSCAKAGIVAPVFSENGDYVKIVFEFKPKKNERKADDERLLDYFKIQPTLTIHEMIEHLDRSKNTVFKVLHQLMDKGLVKQIGKGPATRYVYHKK